MVAVKITSSPTHGEYYGQEARTPPFASLTGVRSRISISTGFWVSMGAIELDPHAEVKLIAAGDLTANSADETNAEPGWAAVQSRAGGRCSALPRPHPWLHGCPINSDF